MHAPLKRNRKAVAKDQRDALNLISQSAILARSWIEVDIGHRAEEGLVIQQGLAL